MIREITLNNPRQESYFRFRFDTDVFTDDLALSAVDYYTFKEPYLVVLEYFKQDAQAAALSIVCAALYKYAVQHQSDAIDLLVNFYNMEIPGRKFSLGEEVELIECHVNVPQFYSFRNENKLNVFYKKGKITLECKDFNREVDCYWVNDDWCIHRSILPSGLNHIIMWDVSSATGRAVIKHIPNFHDTARIAQLIVDYIPVGLFKTRKELAVLGRSNDPKTVGYLSILETIQRAKAQFDDCDFDVAFFDLLREIKEIVDQHGLEKLDANA